MLPAQAGADGATKEVRCWDGGDESDFCVNIRQGDERLVVSILELSLSDFGTTAQDSSSLTRLDEACSNGAASFRALFVSML